MVLNLHLLRVFHAVAGERSFSRAAERLFITQPAVSKAMRELERQLGLPLVERLTGSGRGVRLTDNGRALFEHARGIFAMERAALEDLRGRLGRERGRLLVGASTTVDAYWLPPYLAELARRHPQIDLQVLAGNTEAIRLALVECRVDIAIVEGAVDDPRIAISPWRDDVLQIVARRGALPAGGRRPKLAALDAFAWLQREPGSGTRAVTERLMTELGLRPARRIELGSNEGIARAAAQGLGLAILSARVVEDLVRLRALAVVPPPRPARLARPLYVLQLKERAPAPLVKAFCEVLRTRREAT